jgi:hypothetical protein
MKIDRAICQQRKTLRLLAIFSGPSRILQQQRRRGRLAAAQVVGVEMIQKISVTGRTETYQIIGLDSIHALQLAMFMVGSALQGIRGATDWSCNGEPYTGFPTSLDQPIVGLCP